MSLLTVEGMTFDHGEGTLLRDVSMRLFEREHAVLVGPNGTGKSTLMKLLAKRLIPDSGKIEWMHNKQVGYLDQYASLDESLSLKTYLHGVFEELFQKESLMERLYEDVAHTNDAEKQTRLLNRASALGEDLLENDFYSIKSRIGKVIGGLGLESEWLERPLGVLSGGMRAKAILAKLLLEESDVLLLDEPTNFLDVDHIEWLATFLNAYDKAFIVVSHDEGFLRKIAKTVFALEYGKVERYKGDYAYYEAERALRHTQHERAFESQQKHIKKTEAFIQKNITRASTSNRAKSRRKQLNKLKRIERPKENPVYRFAFPFSKPTGRDVLSVENLEIGYDTPLTDPLNFIIQKGEKVAITGENGIGKSTFIKTVLGELDALGGAYTWIDTANIAYFEQEASFDPAMTPFQIVHAHYPSFTKQDVMALLGHHGIDYTKATRTLGTLSGGESTKVRLALLYHQKGNVLILDEPTNHLDQNAKSALKDALLRYKGTLILVSHEKAFYEDICDTEYTLYG
ncbi:MAG: ABC-F family ATP-binding cassette domain-containing protein [Bacillota bacterium]